MSPCPRCGADRAWWASGWYAWRGKQRHEGWWICRPCNALWPVVTVVPL